MDPASSTSSINFLALKAQLPSTLAHFVYLVDLQLILSMLLIKALLHASCVLLQNPNLK